MATTAKQQRSNSNWEAMLKRWSREQGTHPHSATPTGIYWYLPTHSDETHLPAPEIKWSGEAKEWFKTRPVPVNYDMAERVYRLSISVQHSDNLKECEDFLDELQAYVESMDVASELFYSRDLFHFLRHTLTNEHASLRAKAAEIVTTMVQTHPTSQELIIEVYGLQLLLYTFTSDPDATSRTKALGAISALIQNNEPGITAFRLANGYEALRDALSSESVRLQRDVLNLIQYLLHENSSDYNIVTELGLPRIMMYLAFSDDAEVREAALRGLLVLARDEEGGNSGQLVKNDDMLKEVLQELIEGISAMTPEDLRAAREERQLVDSLWNACYNEPSSLGEKGLLVLPGEDAPAPDVASKLFEPPLRAWAAAEAADRNSVSEKDYNIVTDLGLPCIMMHLASCDDAKVREAALKGLLVLARDEGGNSGLLAKNDDKLKQVLQERIEGISAMAPEDLGVARREIQLVDSLWNACYNEPSSLGVKGLLVLPGEDAPAPAPDVAGKLFGSLERI